MSAQGIFVAMGELIGHVAGLARFPVKSMGGEALAEATLGWSGIVGDRQWALVKEPAHGRFPWFTGRDFSPLITWRAAYAEGSDPKTATPTVTAPDGWVGAVDDPAFIERLCRESGKAMRLMRLGRGAYDSLPVSLVSTAGHAAVEESHGAPIDPRRFRINITIDSDLPMRVWAGRRLTIGGGDGTQLAVTAPIERCVMITIDPDTGERDPWLMRTVAQQLDNKYGVHANVVRPGVLRRGAEVRLS
jgi:uncharacterized protein YcbX